jgi:spore maturation protein B
MLRKDNGEAMRMRYITPTIIFIIVITALIRKKAVYNDFIEGAGGGIRLIADIFPPLIAMLTASAMLKASGALDIAIDFISPFAEKIGLPAEVMPLVLIRPVSGSGSIGVLSGILGEYGADSFVGRLASVICGSTETTFYCLAVYFAKTRVKQIKRALPCAVIGDLTGIAAAVIALRVLGL